MEKRGPAGPAPDGSETQMEDDYPAETFAINERRKTYYGEDSAMHRPRCGLALSGGGIRSATFSLGLLRGLSSLRLLQHIDYLSTVSGGGYAGAFYCGLFAGRKNGEDPVVTGKPDDDLLGQVGAQRALSYLRQSGRYLTPAGFRDYIYALALLFRNWMALSLVAGMAIVLGVLLSDGARAGLCALVASQFEPLAMIGEFHAANPWISPIALVCCLVLPFLLGAGWAYWLTQSDASRLWVGPPFWGTLLIIVAAAFGLLRSTPTTFKAYWGLVAVLALATLGMASWAAAALPLWHKLRDRRKTSQAMAQDQIRHGLTAAQGVLAQAFFWSLILALTDTGSAYLIQLKLYNPFKASLAAIGIPVGRWLIKKLSSVPSVEPGGTGATRQAPLLTRLGPLLAWIAAAIFIGSAFMVWSGVAHFLAFGGKVQAKLDWQSYAPALVGTAVFIGLASVTPGFANLSSLATFYAGRLRSAYLGAGNRARIGAPDAQEKATAVSKTVEGDDLGLVDYYTKTRKAAPVHLINVTVNATRGNGPATVQRDRHGLNLVISPDGISYRLSTQDKLVIHSLGGKPAKLGSGQGTASSAQKKSPGQNLPLSMWIGISGAAFTTGLGSQTSLAKSILAFLTNMRLGYWWNSDRSRCLNWTTYGLLFNEMFASFPGVDKTQWYLSDGGHFENSAVYELVRRRVPLIIASDNGCDPHYGFEDIANLVRKCRIDFGTSIELISDITSLKTEIPDDRVRELFAPPSAFAPGSDNHVAIAMLGRIHYAKDNIGTLIVVKPRLTPDGPADLTRYLLDNADFPQQTTLDQFFDEAQWESYFELGRLIAVQLFGKAGYQGWHPGRMERINW